MCEQLAAVNARDRRRALASAGVEYVQALASLQPAPEVCAFGRPRAPVDVEKGPDKQALQSRQSYRHFPRGLSCLFFIAYSFF